MIGGGQSAIETAALAHEAGANVQVIVRAPQVRWLKRSLKLHQKHGFVRGLLYPPTDVGPPVLNQIVARPHLWKRLPRGLGARVAYRSIRPAAAGWLVPRVADIPITVGQEVRRADQVNQQVRITLDDGSDRSFDHVILCTGYRIDAAKYSFLSHDIHRNLRTQSGYPLLGSGYESSVPGLHFVGACSAISFGPVMRFVSGTTATSREVTNKLLRDAGRSR